MCSFVCACGSKEEKNNSFVGEWKTESVNHDNGKTWSRVDLVKSNITIWIDLVINEDMTYSLIVGDDSETIVNGTVSITETKDGDIYIFSEAELSGIIEPRKENEMIVRGDILREYTFILKRK